MSDKTLVCKDCGKDFVFSVREQEFYAEKGFTNEPSRCSDCRKAKKQQSRNSNRGGFGQKQFGRERKFYPAVCSACGEATQVPFEPRGDKPVFCRDCFQK